MDFRTKPTVPYRKTVAPSTFYNVKCSRCLWLDYWYGLRLPTNLSLQSSLSHLQEKTFDGVDSRDISSELPMGRVERNIEKLSSINLSFAGKETQWKLYGQLDLIVQNEDGTVSIIDCKVSLKKDSQSLIDSYWPQLEAYAFILENPENGKPVEVSNIGLLQWRLHESNGPLNPGFAADSRYIPLKRNRQAFDDFVHKFLEIIQGNFPDGSENCEVCNFLESHRVLCNRLLPKF